MQIAAYCRISVDTELDRDNTSIENQRAIIGDFVREHFPDAQVDYFIDRDRSGYTFAQRENYNIMRSALMDGTYSILMIKDFSRFSRRNSLGLLELETLRDAHVRIISIGDGIDYPTKDDWMLIQFKFLMNEMPVTDTSKKIKAIIANRQKNGRWICAVPYGYRIINTKEMTYEIDPPAAEIVREIFRLYNNGWGYKRIANHLTDSGVPTPRANEISAKEAQGQSTRRTSGSAWSIATVSGILANDFYIGVLRQKKSTRQKINGSCQPLPAENQIVLEHAHTPIIDERTFATTRELLSRRSKSNYRGIRKYDTSYSGFLFCGDCGSPMFSMSRSDLAPAYTCGTYHRRGRKGCSSHHILVSKLDELLKGYVLRVKQNSAEMLAELNAAIQDEQQREQSIGTAIDSLSRQLDAAREQLKTLLKRKIMDTMKAPPEQAEIISETYAELEQELTQRIAALEKQVDQNIDTRNRLLSTNRAAKTVFDVFDAILSKEHLDKIDLGLIIDHINVYEDHLDVMLKADIDALLERNNWEETVNFNSDSEGVSLLVQRSAHRSDKVFTVNVIHKGDPLEIYTDKDGEVIFRKYSLMGGISDFAAQICDTVYKTIGRPALVTDRDTVLAVSGAPRREYSDKQISEALEHVMQGRGMYRQRSQDTPIPIINGSDALSVSVAAPILAQGDVLGCVVLGKTPEDEPAGDTECTVTQTIAGFLGRHMES